MHRRAPRLAAGRARALGLPTRGTTAPNRLRRVDRWLTGTQADLLRAAGDPLVVDLGYGSSPVTTVELYDRLRRVRADVRVVGIERDQERVDAAAPAARPPWLTFARGGFELAGLRPALVRAMNVLRQYDEAAVVPAWRSMAAGLARGGLLVEGTCDELGRRACWLARTEAGTTLTLAAHLASLDRPSALAERLPKSLIAHNTPGTDIYTLLADFDRSWAAAAPMGTFGPRQRWLAAVPGLRAAGWPLAGDRRRWRLGEVTVTWPDPLGDVRCHPLGDRPCHPPGRVPARRRP
jgi:hypothetical protein